MGNILKVPNNTKDYSRRTSTKMSNNESKTQKIVSDKPPLEFYPTHFLNKCKDSYYKEIEECL
jgi:hypothetical protein